MGSRIRSRSAGQLRLVHRRGKRREDLSGERDATADAVVAAAGTRPAAAGRPGERPDHVVPGEEGQAPRRPRSRRTVRLARGLAERDGSREPPRKQSLRARPRPRHARAVRAAPRSRESRRPTRRAARGLREARALDSLPLLGKRFLSTYRMRKARSMVKRRPAVGRTSGSTSCRPRASQCSALVEGCVGRRMAAARSDDPVGIKVCAALVRIAPGAGQPIQEPKEKGCAALRRDRRRPPGRAVGLVSMAARGRRHRRWDGAPPSAAIANGAFVLNEPSHADLLVVVNGTTPTSLSLRLGVEGLNGPLVFPLAGGPVFWQGTTPPLSPSDVITILKGMTTSGSIRRGSTGELRGQLEVPSGSASLRR